MPVTETRWLDERQHRAWRAYLRMQTRLTARMHHELQADAGLSLADFDVLVALSEAPEQRMRPFELSAALEWEKSRLSHHVRRMEQRGRPERIAVRPVISPIADAAISRASQQEPTDTLRRSATTTL